MKLRHLFASALVLALAGLLIQSGAGAGDKDKKDKEVKDKGFDFPKPGPEHKLLTKMVGTFEAKVKMMDPKGGDAIESKGTMKRAMILDGRFLKEDFTGTFLGEKFKGMGLVGFDVEKKKYVATWCDNFSTGFATSEGTFDEKTKTLTSHGEETMKGVKMKTKDVMTLVSDDEQRMEMYRTMGDKEFKVMDITLTRVKDVKKEPKKDAKKEK